MKRSTTHSLIATMWCLTIVVAILEMNLPLRLFVVKGPAARCGWPMHAVELQRNASATKWSLTSVHATGTVTNLIVAALLIAGSHIAVSSMLRLAQIQSVGFPAILALTGMAATYTAISVCQWQPSTFGNDRVLDMLHELAFVIAHTSIASSWLALPLAAESRRRTRKPSLETTESTNSA